MVEETEPKKKKAGKPPPLPNRATTAIARELGFDYDDLQANRDGYMTWKQRRGLMRRRAVVRHFPKFWIIVIAAMALMVLWLATFILSDSSTIVGRIYCGMYFGIILWVIFQLGTGVIPSYVLENWRDIDADLHKGDVSVISGRPYPKEIKDPSGNDCCHIVVADMEFPVTKRLMRAFFSEAYDFYRIYYPPHTRIMLSAEAMFGEPDLEGDESQPMMYDDREDSLANQGNVP